MPDPAPASDALCPQCGAALDPGARAGSPCPKCVLGAAMGAESVLEGEDSLLTPVPDATPSGSGSTPGGWTPPEPSALQAEMPGYEVLSLLGRGGMGAVYKARQLNLDRPVAVKVLPPTLEDVGDGVGFAERFRQEARSMAQLNHPSIIAVYDFGETPDGLLYFAMEFVEGMDILEYLRLNGGKLEPESALAICAHVLDALDYAHRRGVVHRDIKPANVLIDLEGRVRVADFGLAKTLSGAGEESQAFRTLTGVAMGTPAYMAPECLDPSVPTDHRADLYAVGVMLYQMLTGKLPQGRFKMPSEENPQVDPRFDELLERALASDPDYRVSAASEFRLGLDAILSEPVAKPEEESQVAPMTVAREAKREEEKGAAAKRGKARPRSAAGTRQRRARVPKKRKPLGLIAGIGAAAAVVAGLVAAFSGGGKGDVELEAEGTSLAGASIGSGTAAAPPSTPAPAEASKEGPFENSLGMKFVPVPGTDVLFCIHETRWRDYAAYAEENPGIDGQWRTQTYDGFVIEDRPEDHPVTFVSWEDAKKFCTWLSEKEGKTYRLPTDREWSHAVGIGEAENWKADTTPATIFKLPDVFPWGDEWPPPPGAGNYSDESRAKAPRDDVTYLDGYDDGFPTTAPVMSFRPNRLGLYDLGGNVWEWCEDWFSVEQSERVLRGATWASHDRVNLLSSFRRRLAPDHRYTVYGFRVVLDLDSSTQASVSTPPEREAAVAAAPNPILRPEAPEKGEKGDAIHGDASAFVSAGSLRLWSSSDSLIDPSDPSLVTLAEVGDVAQVYQAPGSWIVLRKNGEILSRGGRYDRSGIRAIFPGDLSFVLIGQDGRLEVVPTFSAIEEPESPFDPATRFVWAHSAVSYGDTGIEDGSLSRLVALDEEGQLHLAGIHFEDGESSGRHYWREKPSVPLGRRAVEVSTCGPLLVMRLDDGNLEIWSNNRGKLAPPAELSGDRVREFVVARGSLYGLPRGEGQAFHWRSGMEEPHYYAGVPSGGTLSSAHNGALLVSESGHAILLERSNYPSDLLDPALPHLQNLAPNVASLRSSVSSSASRYVALIWQKAPESATSDSAASAWDALAYAASLGSRRVAPGPRDAAAALLVRADFRQRALAFQRERSERLGQLVGQYGAALDRAEAEALASGSLEAVGTVESEKEVAAALAETLAALAGRWEIEPLAALPELPRETASSLARMRATLESELQRIDRELALPFDRSLREWEGDLKREGHAQTAADVAHFRLERLSKLGGIEPGE